MEKRLGKGKMKWETEEKRQGETGKMEGEKEKGQSKKRGKTR